MSQWTVYEAYWQVGKIEHRMELCRLYAILYTSYLVSGYIFVWKA